MAQPKADVLMRASNPGPGSDRTPGSQDSGAHSASPFARANTVPRSNRGRIHLLSQFFSAPETTNVPPLVQKTLLSLSRPLVHAELETEIPGVLTRCVKVIAGIKKAVAEMRTEAEAATCYRERCSVVLSTAIGASVALDQVMILLPHIPLSTVRSGCGNVPSGVSYSTPSVLGKPCGMHG